jgi:hypothetical protein
MKPDSKAEPRGTGRTVKRTTSIVEARRPSEYSVDLLESEPASTDDEQNTYIKTLATVFGARGWNSKKAAAELRSRGRSDHWMQGSTMGESYLLCIARPPADVTARTFCETRAFTRASLLRLLQQFPNETENIRDAAAGIADSEMPDIDGIKDIDLVNFENEETTYPSVRRGQGSLSFRKMPGAIRLELDLGNILFDTDLDCILEALTYELST